MNYLLVLFIAILSFVSCSENKISSSMSLKNNLGITPEVIYANEQELENISKTKGALNWKMARFLAYDEMVSMEIENGWVGATLSKTPIIIYNSYSEPKYYEFRVIKNGAEVGAITANINPVGGAIAYTLNFIKDYTKSITKVNNGKIIDNNYPSVAFGIIGKSGTKVSALIDEENNNIQESEEVADIIYLVDNYGISEVAQQIGVSEDDVSSILEYRKNNLMEIENEFTLINEALPNIENLSDNEIKEMLSDYTKAQVTYSRKIPKYENLEWLIYGGECGPSVVAWIYAGISSVYNGYNVIQYNNRQRFQNDLRGILKTTKAGVTFPNNFGRTFEKITGGKYTSGWMLAPGSTFKHMKNTDMPAISLRGSRWKKIGWHYRVIYGAREERKEYRFLWWRWSRYKKKLYLHDNTTDGGFSFIEDNYNWDLSHYPVKRK